MEIAARAGEHTEAFCQKRVVEAVVFAAVAAVDFDAHAAEVFKFFKQIALGGGGQVVAHGVGDDRHAARAVDGGDAVFQRRPFVPDGAGLAVPQVFGERLLLVFDVSRSDEELGNVDAALDYAKFLINRKNKRDYHKIIELLKFAIKSDYITEISKEEAGQLLKNLEST